jgi:toxin ParE1/3/4
MRLIVVPAALKELQGAVDFYEGNANAKLGQEFVLEFERAVNLILANPQIGVVFRGNRHRFSLRRFPYNIIYHIGTEELRIVAIAHQRRRPAYWTHRK